MTCMKWPFLRADIDPEYQGSEFAEVLGVEGMEVRVSWGINDGEQKSSEKTTSNFVYTPEN